MDRHAWRRLLQWQLDAGVDGLVVAGTTGEAPALRQDEFEWLLGSALEMAAGRAPVVAGTGLSSTARTIEQTRLAARLGADAALVVTPAYVRPTQDGMAAHFNAVAEQGGLPVVLYNVPARTGCDMRPATVAELARHAGIVAIKEAFPDPARMQALLELRRPDFAVLSGDDASATAALLAGADGVISVASNVAPAACAALCRHCLDGRADAAWALDARLQPVHAFLGVEPNPIPLKALLARRGIGHGLRLPLTPLDAAYAARLAATEVLVAALELSCGDS